MTGLRPLSIGEILDGAFSIYRRHFVVLVTTTGLLTLPGTLLQVPFPFLAAIVGMLCSYLAAIALTVQTSEALLGGRPDLASAVAMAARRLLPVTGALIVMMLALGLVSAPLAGAVFYVARLWAPDRSGLGVGSYLAILALLAALAAVPPSYFAMRWFAVLQVMVLEPTRHFLRRSAVLANGALTKISVVWFVGFLIALVPGALVGGGQGVVLAMVREGMLPDAALFAALALAWIVSALTSSLLIALVTVLYYDQRVRKDGLDVELAVSRAIAPASAVPQPAGT
jgi:hypothetical protein